MTLTKTALALSAVTALGIGAAVLFAPVEFYAMSAVALPDDVNLIGDIRAFGGGVLAFGLFLCLGIMRPWLTQPALIAAATIYAGFGLARVWALAVDGIPTASFFGGASAGTGDCCALHCCGIEDAHLASPLLFVHDLFTLAACPKTTPHTPRRPANCWPAACAGT